MSLELSLPILEEALLNKLDTLFPGDTRRRSESRQRPTKHTLHHLNSLAQRAAPSVHSLWQLFNARRPDKMPKYMDNPDYLAGYLSAFVLPNVSKLGHLLLSPALRAEVSARLSPESPRGPAKGSHKNSGRSPSDTPVTLTMTDYGAGPLTATLALCMALIEILKHESPSRASTSKNAGKPRVRLKSIVIESGDEIFAAGEFLLDELREHFFEHGLEVEIVRASLRTAEHFGPSESDFVIAANALNELTSSTRRDLQKFMGRCLDQKALVLVVEPGQDTHSKLMASFRDGLLEAHPKATVLGPCPHRHKCPLGPDSAKSDWCWFRTEWEPTPWVKVLDERTGLRHSELNYSFFALASQPRAEAPKSWGRIVSDRITFPEAPVTGRRRLLTYLKTNSPQRALPFEDAVMLKGPLSKTLVCTREGTLVGVYDKLTSGPQRGEDVPTKPKSVWIAPERTDAKTALARTFSPGGKPSPARPSGAKSSRSKPSTAPRRPTRPSAPRPKRPGVGLKVKRRTH